MPDALTLAELLLLLSFFGQINPVSSCEEGKGSFRLRFGVPNIDVALVHHLFL